MSQTTEGFILGITATLTGILLYLFCTYSGAILFGVPEDSPGARPASTIAAPVLADAGPSTRE